MEDGLDREHELIESAKHDIQAFAIFYERYYGKIFNYVLRRTGNTGAAQDITADVFLKAQQNIGKYQYRGIPFSAWLYRVATHEIADHYHDLQRERKLTADIRNVVELADNSIEDEIEQAERDFRTQKELGELQSILIRLPLHYQTVIALRYFEKKGIEEIAAILEKSEGAVKLLLNRSLKKMRQLMEKA